MIKQFYLFPFILLHNINYFMSKYKKELLVNVIHCSSIIQARTMKSSKLSRNKIYK